MSLIVRDYECAEHGGFELIEERSDVGDKPCPACGAPSEYRISAVRLKFPLVSLVRGKYEPPPAPHFMDTSAFADGRGDEWREKREKYWDDQREKQNREALS